MSRGPRQFELRKYNNRVTITNERWRFLATATSMSKTAVVVMPHRSLATSKKGGIEKKKK